MDHGEDVYMRILKSKIITIVTFWLLTGMIVFCLPLQEKIKQKLVVDNDLLEDKVSLVRLDALDNL